MTLPLALSLQNVELGLAVLGWVVAFLLGKELANGFFQWRNRRAPRTRNHRDD